MPHVFQRAGRGKQFGFHRVLTDVRSVCRLRRQRQGRLKNMRYAFAYGADAVYAGQPRYSLRVRNNEFTHGLNHE
jgi:hypothetical protein